MVEEIQDAWRNTGWLKEYRMLEEYRMVEGIQDAWRNTRWLEEYRMVGGTQDG